MNPLGRYTVSDSRVHGGPNSGQSFDLFQGQSQSQILNHNQSQNINNHNQNQSQNQNLDFYRGGYQVVPLTTNSNPLALPLPLQVDLDGGAGSGSTGAAGVTGGGGVGLGIGGGGNMGTGLFGPRFQNQNQNQQQQQQQQDYFGGSISSYNSRPSGVQNSQITLNSCKNPSNDKDSSTHAMGTSGPNDFVSIKCWILFFVIIFIC